MVGILWKKYNNFFSGWAFFCFFNLGLETAYLGLGYWLLLVVSLSIWFKLTAGPFEIQSFIASLYLFANCGLFANFLSRENTCDKAIFLLFFRSTLSLFHKRQTLHCLLLLTVVSCKMLRVPLHCFWQEFWSLLFRYTISFSLPKLWHHFDKIRFPRKCVYT